MRLSDLPSAARIKEIVREAARQNGLEAKRPATVSTPDDASEADR